LAKASFLGRTGLPFFAKSAHHNRADGSLKDLKGVGLEGGRWVWGWFACSYTQSGWMRELKVTYSARSDALELSRERRLKQREAVHLVCRVYMFVPISILCICVYVYVLRQGRRSCVCVNISPSAVSI
jgi:hypothetical protein